MTKCTYGGWDCNDMDLWHHSLSGSYGNCFTFNTMANMLDSLVPRKTSLTGTTNGGHTERS